MTISNNTALVAALKAAQPGAVLALAQDFTGGIDLRGIKFPEGEVVVVGAGPLNGVEVDGCEGLRLKNMTVRSDWSVTFNVTNSARIAVDGVDLGDVPGSGKAGMMFRWSRDVGVVRSKIHDLGTGFRAIDCDGVTVANNDFRDLRGDGVQFNGCNRVVIGLNRFTDFFPQPGDHPDAIQFFTHGQTEGSRDITITGNTVIRGKGGIVQGVFLGNEASLPYVNVKITNNAIVGAMYRGISVGGGVNVTIRDNAVFAYTDMDSNIYAEAVDGLVIGGNTAMSVSVDARCSNVTNHGFTKVAPAQVGDLSVLEAWRAALSTPTESEPPVVVEPPPVVEPEPLPPEPAPGPVDTRDAQIAALTAAGLAEVAGLRARAERGEADKREIAEIAAAGLKVTSAAKAKPLFAQIAALAKG